MIFVQHHIDDKRCHTDVSISEIDLLILDKTLSSTIIDVYISVLLLENFFLKCRTRAFTQQTSVQIQQ